VGRRGPKPSVSEADARVAAQKHAAGGTTANIAASLGCSANALTKAWRRIGYKPGKGPRPLHGHASYGSASSTYRTWNQMVQRCTNPSATNYGRYGGAGVKVCDRWLSFADFVADMGERPEGTSLGRFGDVGNYEPGNCAWQTSTEQGAEKRKKRAAKNLPDSRTSSIRGTFGCPMSDD
jgi:hypothetical protein